MRRWAFVWCLVAPGLLQAADLTVPIHDPAAVRLRVLSDTQCPLVCGDSLPRTPSPTSPIPCCDTFNAIADRFLERPDASDFTLLNGDWGLESHAILYPWVAETFYGIWDRFPGPKGATLGNHEADPGTDSTKTKLIWADTANHYAPANWWEPLYGCGPSTPVAECRRWFSVLIGDPARAALLVVSNNSDELLGDTLNYLYCAVPGDSLNHAGSTQRVWFNAQVDSLPASVEVVFVAGHRTYYGVENYQPRPNIHHSFAEFPATPAETLRTGEVSFLRDVESIYDRKPNVKKVLFLSGDQHCFAQTVPIRRNVRDDARGVVYVTLGISGAKNNRATPYPALSKIPPGTLVAGFDDLWGSVEFRIESGGVLMEIQEAYTDSLLYETRWDFPPPPVFEPVGVSPSPPAVEGPCLSAWPNPADRSVDVALSIPVESQGEDVRDIAVFNVAGRRVRSLHRGSFLSGEYRRTWRLVDDSGTPVPNGVYFVCVELGDRRLTTKVTVLR